MNIIVYVKETNNQPIPGAVVYVATPVDPDTPLFTPPTTDLIGKTEFPWSRVVDSAHDLHAYAPGYKRGKVGVPKYQAPNVPLRQTFEIELEALPRPSAPEPIEPRWRTMFKEGGPWIAGIIGATIIGYVTRYLIESLVEIRKK